MDNILKVKLTAIGANQWNAYWEAKYAGGEPHWNSVTEGYEVTAKESVLLKILDTLQETTVQL
jgi:hypothetical protein